MKQETPMSLQIVSRMENGDGAETYTHTATGTLRQVGDHHSLAFSSRDENGAKTMNALSWQKGVAKLHLKRRGAVKWEVLFDPTLPAMTRYELPPLACDLRVTCHGVDLALDEFGGTISLTYTREIGGDTARVTYTLTACVAEDAP